MRDPIGNFIATSFVILAFVVFISGMDSHLKVFAILGLGTLVIAVLSRNRVVEMIVSIKEFKVKLSRVESQLAEIASALETLIVAQQITELGPSNEILLNHDPVPQSIRIICGPLVHFPRESYGYHLDGRCIQIVSAETLASIQSRLPSGVTVEYLRRIQSSE